MREIGIGIIGTGMMGKTHTYAIRNLPLFYKDLPFKARLIGICSRQPDNAERFREALGFEFATDDYQKLICHPDVEVVCICTPNNLHHQMVIAAAKAGKHIYCEKPLAANEKESEEMLEALREKDLVHQIVFNNRFFPATIRAKQMVQEGRIGKIQCFRIAYLQASAASPNRPVSWKQDKHYAGGVLLDLGSHVLDILYSMLGDYKRITAKTRTVLSDRTNEKDAIVDNDAENSIVMIAEMMDGSIGTIEATNVATGINNELRFEIHGDRGAIRFNLMEPDWLDYFDETGQEAPFGGDRGYKRIECIGNYELPSSGFPSTKSSIGWLRAHVHSLYCFLDCVAAGRSAEPSLVDGAYIQHIIECARMSDEKGCWIDCCHDL